jgi:hypothetical protein
MDENDNRAAERVLEDEASLYNDDLEEEEVTHDDDFEEEKATHDDLVEEKAVDVSKGNSSNQKDYPQQTSNAYTKNSA